MRITSWNVNGLRTIAPLAPRLAALHNPDIVCVQETRVAADDAALEHLALVPRYHSFFAMCAARRGYSGVATYCRKGSATPVAAAVGLADATGAAAPIPPAAPCPAAGAAPPCPCRGRGYSAATLDAVRREGRVVVTDHARFVLLNVYVPATGRGDEERLAFKMSFLHALRAKVDALRAAGRHVVVAGDFNVCHARIDSADQMAGLPDPAWPFRPSRRWLTALLDPADGRCVDAFRRMHPARRGAYTCWSEATRGRENNHGVRIDLVVVDDALFERDVLSADVWPHVTGSDHCPVTLELRDSQHTTSKVPQDPPRLRSQFLPRFVKRQRSLRDYWGQRTKHLSQPSTNDGSTATTTSTAKPVPSAPAQTRKRKRTASPAQTSLKSYFAVRGPQQTACGEDPRQAELRPGSSSASVTSKVQPHTPETDTEPVRKRAKQESNRIAWRKLLSGPPPPPRCRHGVPAVSKTVGKSGENRGRKFFSCPYPVGSGRKSNCNFFQWAIPSTQTRENTQRDASTHG